MRRHVPLVPLAPRQPPPLGPLATLFWGLMIFLGSGFLSGMWMELAAVSEWRGFSFVYAPIECALIFAVIRRQSALPVRQYLCIAPTPPRTILRWTGLLALLIVVEEILTLFIESPSPSRDGTGGHSLHDRLWAIWLALIVAAPLMEEGFFRGFLFKGLEASAMGPWGAIFVTSLTWAMLHVQYDATGVALVFVAGLLLGAARAATQSIVTPVLLHAGMNLWVCAESLLMGRLPV